MMRARKFSTALFLIAVVPSVVAAVPCGGGKGSAIADAGPLALSGSATKSSAAMSSVSKAVSNAVATTVDSGCVGSCGERKYHLSMAM